MGDFLQYWTAADYILLICLTTTAAFCTFMAIRAERAVSRNERAEMSVDELREANEAMQQALKQWELCEACADALERQYG